MFNLTNHAGISMIISVLYITFLNSFLLYGLLMLADGMLPTAHHLLILFKFPFYLLTISALLALNIKIKPTSKDIKVEKEKVRNYTYLIVYTAAAIAIRFYIYILPQFGK